MNYFPPKSAYIWTGVNCIEFAKEFEITPYFELESSIY